MELQKKALESYVKGNAYKKAVALAKRYFPSNVVMLEEQ